MPQSHFPYPTKELVKQPELRLVFYMLPLFLILVIIGFSFLSLPWGIIVLGIAAVAITITGVVGWRLAAASLDVKTQSGQMESVISYIGTGVLAYNTNFSVLIFNQAAAEIFGVREEEIVGQVLSTTMVSNPQFKALAQVVFTSLAPSVVQQSDEGVYPSVVDIVFENPHLELRVVTNRIFDAAGQLVGFVKMITNRTREAELLRAKSEFISIAAHQLRTPLTAVTWALEALEKETVTQSQKELIDTGYVASKLMLKTVNDLLDVSKMEEGRFGYQFADVSIVDFLSTVLADAQVVAGQYGVTLYFQRPAKPVPPVFIDQQKMSMALFNLLDNAIKYNVVNGEVTIGVHNEDDRPFIKITIQDTGIGIPKDQTEKLFTKFFRGDNAMKVAPNGTGLGLYITKNIIVRHGGSIVVESELNRGTTFSIELPTDKSLVPKREATQFE
ncbi:MAG: ATP-binding protein [Candidatus Paceibacterota bacterium]|jgi:signal transduction histidine kinase